MKSKYFFLLYHVSVPHYYELFCKAFGLFLTFVTVYTISDKGSDVVIFQRGDSFHPVGGSKPAARLQKEKVYFRLNRASYWLRPHS